MSHLILSALSFAGAGYAHHTENNPLIPIMVFWGLFWFYQYMRYKK